MGFIIHFYITFRTNLLTRGPAQIVVFLPISVFQRKGISNGSKRNKNFGGVIFGMEAIQETWSGRQGSFEVATRQGGPPAPWARPLSRGVLEYLLT